MCVRVCLRAAVLGGCGGGGRGLLEGGPWGEAGQSLPVAAPGQGMAIQDTCLGSQPELMTTASLRPSVRPSISPSLTSRSGSSPSGDADPPLTPLSLQVLRCLFHFIACPPFFQQFAPLPTRLSLPAGVSLSPSLFLSLSKFSILARLYFFISGAVWEGAAVGGWGGGGVRGSWGGRWGGVPGDVRVH